MVRVEIGDKYPRPCGFSRGYGGTLTRRLQVDPRATQCARWGIVYPIVVGPILLYVGIAGYDARAHRLCVQVGS